MISPKYATTHYFYAPRTLNAATHSVNLYLDYNCPFSAKLFTKLHKQVIPELNKKHPSRFQFIFVNVVQPWHVNSNLLHEFSLAVAKLTTGDDSNQKFWQLSQVLFDNKEHFYDTANINLNRNEIYEQIYSVVAPHYDLPEKKAVLELLQIPTDATEPSNGGNGVTNDLKYFTKYHRKAGIHVTPTVSVDGVVDDLILSGSEPDELVSKFESNL